MAVYRVDFVDHGNNVYAIEHMEQDADRTVIEEVHRRNAHGIGAGFDIWDGERLVHRHRH